MVAEASITTKPSTPSQIWAADGATHEHADAEDEDGCRGDGAHLRDALESASAQGRCELGVLLGKRMLHLLQQTKLLFGERHGFLPHDWSLSESRQAPEKSVAGIQKS